MAERILSGVGADLRRAREAAGLGMAEVAQRLKLLPRQIESLEHERFERLPGPTIARGMVRNYAQLLGLDPEPIVARMSPGTENSAQVPPSARHRERAPSLPPGRRSTLLYVGFSVALLALAGAAAYEWQREKAAAPDTVAAVPPAPPMAVEAPPPVEAQPLEKPVEQPVEQPVARETEAPALAEAEAPAQPEPLAAPQPAVAPNSHRLVLRMQEEAWLEVRDGAGTSLVASLNPAGTERVVRGRPPFRLVIGNAAHVKLSYDGKPVDLKPHTRGEVARFTLP